MLARVSVEAPLREGYYAQGTRILRAKNGKAHAVAQLAGIGSLRGKHNAQNAACAVAACVALGLDLAPIQKGLTTFPGLAHRMQPIGKLGNVLFVNDSKATNADSAAKALASYDDIFWIAGGRAKTGGIESLAEFFPRIRKAYLIGEAPRNSPRRSTARRRTRSRSFVGRRRCGHARRASLRREGAGGAAVAGLRLVRPVPEFRAARPGLCRSVRAIGNTGSNDCHSGTARRAGPESYSAAPGL